MKHRRNAPLSSTDIAALRRILFNHGARPGEREIPTAIIRRKKNPRRKTKVFGPGKRWKTKTAMIRYMAKIRRLAAKKTKRARR